FLPEDGLVNKLKKNLVSNGIKQMMAEYGCRNFACSRVMPDNAPKLYTFVEKTCLNLGIAVPRIYITHDHNLVNCAAGGDMILLGIAFLRQMDQDGVEFVIAHELGHIAQKNVELKKTALMIATSIPGCLDTAYKHVKNFFIPGSAKQSTSIIQDLISAAYSRSLEYDADKKAYKATNNLAGAKKVFEFFHKKEAAADNEQPFQVYIDWRYIQISNIKCLRSHPLPAERLEALSV
ncbi:MAG TPA: M48 family metalloprotease, partial [Candidatus Babeliales bacterium]|nr:M48 family metalloprotease [Candidatus Babeliales bacterium]